MQLFLLGELSNLNRNNKKLRSKKSPLRILHLWLKYRKNSSNRRSCLRILQIRTNCCFDSYGRFIGSSIWFIFFTCTSMGVFDVEFLTLLLSSFVIQRIDPVINLCRRVYQAYSVDSCSYFLVYIFISILQMNILKMLSNLFPRIVRIKMLQ